MSRGVVVCDVLMINLFWTNNNSTLHEIINQSLTHNVSEGCIPKKMFTLFTLIIDNFSSVKIILYTYMEKSYSKLSIIYCTN